MKAGYCTIFVLVSVVFFVGCVNWITTNKGPAPKNYYEIVSTVGYDSGLCGGVSYNHKQNGFNSGLRLILRDNGSGERLKGYATISFEGHGGSLSLGEEYSCEEQIISGDAVVSAFSGGYAPVVFKFSLPENQLATVEVFMVESCGGGPSCVENAGILGRNQTEAERMMGIARESFFGDIQRLFGLNDSEYELQCMECNMGRGGFIKARGVYLNKTPFGLYYRWGWCSSGGVDCGWSICFTSFSEGSDDLFEFVKNKSCSMVYSTQSDAYDCPRPANKTYDITGEVRKDCFTGKFEEILDGRKTLSINQVSGRCSSSVQEGKMNCLEN